MLIHFVNEGAVSMKVVGYVFLVIIAVGVVGGIGLALASIPDLRRYMRIRSM
jgi:hypothetical protein